MERKHSKKRDAILACIRDTDVHPSAEWVYSQLKPQYPDLSLATVYRNLALFKKEGLINSVGTVRGLERFDGITTPHVHFICTECGCIQDLPSVPLPQDLERFVAADTGGQVHGFSLYFQGICRNCQQKHQASKHQED